MPVATSPRPYIFFAGTSLSYLPEEIELVERLGAAVAELWPDLTVWYRPHPRSAGRSFLHLVGKPGVTLDSATVRGLDATSDGLRDLIDQSRCVVSFFSTIIIEAALRRVPSAVVAFGGSTGGSEHGGSQPVGRLADHMRFEHMRDVLGWPGIMPCRSFGDLLASISRVTNALVPLDELQRRAQAVARVDGFAKERIVAAVAAVMR